MDSPAAHLQVASALALLAGGMAIVSEAFGVAVWRVPALLILLGAVFSAGATLLTLAAELQRSADVAALVLAVQRPPQHPHLPLEARICNALAELEAAQGGAARATSCPRAIAWLLAGRLRSPLPPLAALARATSPLVTAGLSANACASLCLATGAALLLAQQTVAGLIVLEAAFALFLVGIAFVLRVGARKVAAHRRGGRAHLEYDAKRALEGWA